VLALSGYGTPRDLSETAQARFAGHVVKPADPETLKRAIEAALASAPRS
jgi:DNA-binding NarL/FixJ family response regulator